MSPMQLDKVVKQSWSKTALASSLDETQWNRGRRSAVNPRFRLAPSRLRTELSLVLFVVDSPVGQWHDSRPQQVASMKRSGIEVVGAL